MTRRKPPEPRSDKTGRTRKPAARAPEPAAKPPERGVMPIPLYSRIAGDAALSLEHTEWVLTNAMGGFAMGTALGLPTRRYHAMLVCDSAVSSQRCTTLSHMVERLTVRTPGGADEVHDLSTFRFAGSDPAGVVHPGGHSRLVRFEKDVACRWVFHAGAVEVIKELLLPKGTRSAMLRYQVKSRRSAIADVRLELLPLVSLRDYHSVRHRDGGERAFVVEPLTGPAGSPQSVRVRAGGASITIAAEAASFRAGGSSSPGALEGAGWWNQFLYRIERERGQDHLEDLYCPGVLTADLSARKQAESVVVRFGVDDRELASLGTFENELNRLRRHADEVIASSLRRAPIPGEADIVPLAGLALAADDFVVHPRGGASAASPRDMQPTSIIAGYPWFTDWGRDTMISLPGLLLEAGRFDEALAALRRFADSRRGGIIPNRFTDAGPEHGADGRAGAGEPEYNTIDASLWFIIASCRYLEAGGDRARFDQHLLTACLDVVEHYRHGTEFGIGMDPTDFLIAGGSAATQLTWMDARRDGICFTPRHGKAVEINALWHSALRQLAEVLAAGSARGATATGRPASHAAADLRALADAVAGSFRATFYSDALGCCFDTITPDPSGRWLASSEIRPNQVFAVSLPHSPLMPAQQESILRVVREQLLTPFGLRTLAPGARGYAPRFRGSMFQLDAAYHNGTAWPWLLGPYAEAVARVGSFSPRAIGEARDALGAIIRKLDAECVGSIAEVFDAEGTPGDPQRAGGCPAQAWSVAETRRVLCLLARKERDAA